jgi:very-short-patch-repair endonuclease
MVSQKMVYDRETRDLIKDRAQKLRKKQTGAEYHLRNLLKRSGEKRVLRQCVVGRLILDLGLPYRNLLVEVDDPSHAARQDRDTRRDAWLRNLGFNVLRVTNDAVFHNHDRVLHEISRYPVKEDNRIKFQMSIRAARAKSYWKENEFDDETPVQQTAGGDWH